MIYIRERKRPRAGTANFCGDCGTDEALRQADRRRKRKMQDARKLYSEHVTCDEIAQKLDVRNRAGRTGAEIVSGWVSAEKGGKDGKARTE